MDGSFARDAPRATRTVFVGARLRATGLCKKSLFGEALVLLHRIPQQLVADQLL
jgi:hypothetical protein